MSSDPTQTLYITNLSGKTHTPGKWTSGRISHVHKLKASLYGLFSTYGVILAINAINTEKMREQAFIAFDNVASATSALRSLNGFTFYDRPLKIVYAKTKSDVVAKLDGTYRPKVADKKASSSNRTLLGKRAVGDDLDDAPMKSRKIESDEDDDSE
ncbi:hypothetical protein PHYBLDRAFT_79926 [Phycomyces blakesleeanus NRRL 1555(-)]|uniref:RRM domain-containing protein n=2 Tax=Phycomyces blakesleeanus TaxID=4837 RepID=A0A167JBB7_PHYB8|nr:hypothetical protein PHYBLDRAFT_79926 [Phycomyces blakesleeanus NRRL 1555(-)]OAD65638.1 hypothetical protein PHYBLDRAFT_79926 [Phycomyces blakesleeanus NRRL 1555(-)]|eukprot:XP_018283678.1 hypothetical protein PHYBLDRAFT_79926 [Phycomyces blakesleeanus NRRL 1555(-)]